MVENGVPESWGDVAEQIVRAHFRKRAGVAAERSPQSFVNVCVEHGEILFVEPAPLLHGEGWVGWFV